MSFDVGFGGRCLATGFTVIDIESSDAVCQNSHESGYDVDATLIPKLL